MHFQVGPDMAAHPPLTPTITGETRCMLIVEFFSQGCQA